MNFFGDIKDILTGKDRIESQSQLVNQTLAAELEQQKLKYSPELSAQRTKQVQVVAVVVLILAGLFIYFKFGR